MNTFFKRARLTATTWAAALMLAACGGGDDAPAITIVAGADTLTIALGASASVLGNDTLGGTAANAGAGGNVTFTITTGTPPAGVTVSNGTVAVAASAAPGSFSFTYALCQAGSTTNCVTATVQVTVPAPAIVAVADSFTLAAGASGDVLANDTLGGAAATAATVGVSATGALPTGISLSAAGVLAVDATAVQGIYAVPYRICQTLAPSNCATATASVTVPAAGVLSGRVLDAATALAVAGATVQVGGSTVTTDATGAFNLTTAPLGAWVPVNITAAGYAESSRITTVAATGSNDVQVRLVRVATTGTVDAATGGTVSLAGSTAQVVLPANGLQRADGSLPTGSISVALTPIAPASDSSVMPGDFTTLVGGVPTPIESFGALNVQLRDASGAALNLRPGQQSTIRIPVSSRSSTRPATIPLFFFDTTTGRWVQEGSATLVGTGAAAYYEGNVTHFSTWNADQVYNSVRVTGCVTDVLGARVANAFVGSDGIDYSGTTSTMTDAAGNFSIVIRKDSLAALTGVAGGRLTNTLSVGPYAQDATLAECLSLSQTGSGVTMKLTWGALPSDLDSYLYTPSGTRVYYSNEGSLTAAPYANLDVDDTSSYGPEVITITRLMVGTYKYAVNNYSGYSQGPISTSGARVELSIPGRTVELFVPPADEPSGNSWWLLFEIDVDASCNVTVRRVGNFGTEPSTATNVAVQYCTAP
ncbi:hypothetical protein IP87_14050 [beta proteobacterium AAP121]|nr:hypothetical protein IP80_15925 [beta proteobacterium AAP65]KPF96422.1 hypothetical protein IP87_14050 [beta proteobacterium AAP121]